MRSSPKYHLTALLISAALLAACGDPLVTGDYKGEPLLRVEGNIVLQSELAAKDLGSLGRLQVALFWLANLSPSGDTVNFRAEAGSVAQGLASPARYAFDLYHPPSDAVLVTMPDSSQPVGFALVLLFDDLNGDGARQETEPFVGGTRGLMLLYTPQTLSSDLIGTTLAPGFHLLSEVTAQNPDPLTGPPTTCRDDATVAAFVRLDSTDQVDLDLDFIDDPWQRVPDVNCDGSITEWCEEMRPYADLNSLPTPELLMERICFSPQPEREAILNAYTLCQNQFQETDDCLPNFDRCDDPAMQMGPPWTADHPIVEYYLCRHPELNHDGCADLFGYAMPQMILHDPINMVIRACKEQTGNPERLFAFTDAYRRCFTDPCFSDEVVNNCPSIFPFDPTGQAPPTPIDAVEMYLECVSREPEGKPRPNQNQSLP